jgi:glycosyltransferase involved in cell wall biosynthesis
MGERVTWTGVLAPAEVAAALRSCDLGCLPFRDGVSLRHGTLMAAISQGLPLVTTVRPGPLSSPPFPRLEGERDALLVPAGDPLALAGAMQRLIDDPGLRGRLGAGASRLAETFRWETIARQTSALYREL